MGMNKTFLMGWVGGKPKIIKNMDKTTAAKFMVGTKTYRFNKMFTDWHFVQGFGKTAEYIEKHVEKGDYIYIDGYGVAANFKANTGYEIKEYTVHIRSIEILRKRKYSEKDTDGLFADEEVMDDDVMLTSEDMPY